MPEYPNTPANVAAIHGALWNHVVDLEGQWQTYKRLFMDEPTVEVLNWAASGFFAKTQRSLVDEMMLSIARLLDKAKGAQDNAVLERLAQECDTAGRKDVGDRVRRCIAKAEALTDPIRKQRNKRIGHLDFAVHVDKKALPPVIVREVSDALRLIKAAMNVVEKAFEGRETKYSAYNVLGGADTLAYVLKRAKEADDRGVLEP